MKKKIMIATAVLMFSLAGAAMAAPAEKAPAAPTASCCPMAAGKAADGQPGMTGQSATDMMKNMPKECAAMMGEAKTQPNNTAMAGEHEPAQDQKNEHRGHAA